MPYEVPLVPFEIEPGNPGQPIGVFPTGYDRSVLEDVTPVGSYWKLYRNIETGEIVDCSLFANRASGIA